MGKNYYAYIKSEEEDWSKRKEQSLSEAKDMKGLISIIEQYYDDRQPKEIHLGKSSAGWKFLFQYNDGKYYKTKQELYNFIQELDIADEYGTSYTWEEFWESTLDENRMWNNKRPQSVSTTE